MANALGRIAQYSFALGVVATTAQNSLFVVNGGHRAVMFSRISGVDKKVRGEVRGKIQKKERRRRRSRGKIAMTESNQFEKCGTQWHRECILKFRGSKNRLFSTYARDRMRSTQ